MATRPFPSSERLTEAVTNDYPGAEIRVSFSDDWQLVHRFERLNKPLYVAGFPPSQERPRGNHFLGLSREINLSLTTYRQYKLFEPRTAHLFQVAWNSYIGQGRIIGGGGLQVQLQPLGEAQIWKGDTDGVLWECYRFGNYQRQEGWQEELTTFWQAVERDLGVKRIFTQPHDPSFEEGYPEFLNSLGYAPDPNFERWWSKNYEGLQVDGRD